MSTQAQILMTATEAQLYQKGEYVESAEVDVEIYFTKDYLIITVGEEEIEYEILDIHDGDDGSIHFATSLDKNQDVVEELIYSEELEQVILVNYPSKTYVLFPKVTVTRVSREWKAM